MNLPESVIAIADGRLYAGDKEFGVISVDDERDPAARVEWPFEEFVPNGIALQEDGTFLITRLGPEGGLAPDCAREGRVPLEEARGSLSTPLNFLSFVRSVSHFSFGVCAWKSRLMTFSGAGLISPRYDPYSRLLLTITCNASCFIRRRMTFSARRNWR